MGNAISAKSRDNIVSQVVNAKCEDDPVSVLPLFLIHFILSFLSPQYVNYFNLFRDE